LGRRLLAELLGSAFLAAVVIGSGIAAQRLSPGETGLELLVNAAATPSPASQGTVPRSQDYAAGDGQTGSLRAGTFERASDG
jgi:hypothetical protein